MRVAGECHASVAGVEPPSSAVRVAAVADHHDPTKPQRGGQPKRGGQDRSWKLWLGIVALIILIVFVVQNSQEVEVDFLFTTTTTPLIFALVFAGVLGALVGWLLPRVLRGRRREHD